MNGFDLLLIFGMTIVIIEIIKIAMINYFISKGFRNHEKGQPIEWSFFQLDKDIDRWGLTGAYNRHFKNRG